MNNPDAYSIAWPVVRGTSSDARSMCEGRPDQCTRIRLGSEPALAQLVVATAVVEEGGRQRQNPLGRIPPPPLESHCRCGCCSAPRALRPRTVVVDVVGDVTVPGVMLDVILR